MHIAALASYLVLHEDVAKPSRRKLDLVDSLAEAVADWTASSRLSPIWAVKSHNDRNLHATLLKSKCRITFIGPVNPAKILADIKGIESGAVFGIWVTAGCFNLIVGTTEDAPGLKLAEEMCRWGQAHNIAYEQWSISKGIVGDAKQHTVETFAGSDILDRLASFASQLDQPSLRPHFQENLIATSTSLARSAAVMPQLSNDLVQVAGATCAQLEAFAAGHLTIFDIQARLLSMNAALSRFSSQAFSGIPPIRETECHFWIHSLLGTGSANLALSRVATTIQHQLGEARLPERIAALEEIAKPPSTDALIGSPDILNFDVLKAVSLNGAINSEAVVPLVTYFSGRDGFSSHLQTLSAPLTTIAECNSYRSNLLTVTHEISHIFVQSVLAVLSPTPGDEQSMATASRLTSPKYQPTNHLEAAQILLLEAIIGMEAANRGAADFDLEIELPELIERWRSEVQEILVHAFDFLYFNSGDPDYYVSSIWHSWCAIPGIGDRVPEYLMRTLSAASANLLTAPPDTRFPAALGEVKKILAKLKDEIGVQKNYVTQALTQIAKIETDTELFSRTEKEFSARLLLTRLVKIFLYSETLAAALHHDPYQGSGLGYQAKKPLHYDLTPIGNPLVFLKTRLKENPTEAESLWTLHCLAFDLQPSSGRL